MDNRDAVRLQFGQHAEKYRKSKTHADLATLDRIVDLISPSGGDKALDVGCGGGHMAAAIAKKVRELIAVDITPEMLVQTGKLAGAGGLQNLRFCLADATNLPFLPSSFEIITCRIVLHHVSDAAKAVAEMGHVLKKNGSLFIQDILGPDDYSARSYMDEIEMLRDPSHIKNYNLKEWNSFLDRSGLEVTHSEMLHGVYDLKEWTNRSGTSVNHLEKIKIRLRNMPKVVQEHLKTSYSEGDWHIQMRYILLLATKT